MRLMSLPVHTRTLSPCPLQAGLPPTRLWQVDQELGGWAKAQSKFFDAGAILDELQAELGRKRMEARRAAEKRR